MGFSCFAYAIFASAYTILSWDETLPYGLGLAMAVLFHALMVIQMPVCRAYSSGLFEYGINLLGL